MGCAQYLLDRPAAEQTQIDLKRAISTLYYAMFHELATACADFIAGPRSGPHNTAAWKQCFRALEHKYSKIQCQQVAAEANDTFPKEIKDFANLYATMQLKRHRADYSPDGVVYPTDVRQAIGSVNTAIQKLRQSAEADKRAFCAFVLLKQRSD